MRKIFLLLLIAPVLVFSAPRYPFATQAQSQQFYNLTKHLRCLVCQNETLYDSQAKLAVDLRGEVYRMVKSGKTNQQIKAYMVHRYGDFVLFDPPVNHTTWPLWFGPIIALLIGLGIWLFLLLRKQKG